MRKYRERVRWQVLKAFMGIFFGPFIALPGAPYGSGRLGVALAFMAIYLLFLYAILYLGTFAHNSWIRQIGVKGQVERELIQLDFNWLLDAVVVGLVMGCFFVHCVAMTLLYFIAGDGVGMVLCALYALVPFFLADRCYFELSKLMIRLHWRMERDKGVRIANA